jgi:hypothetical protein
LFPCSFTSSHLHFFSSNNFEFAHLLLALSDLEKSYKFRTRNYTFGPFALAPFKPKPSEIRLRPVSPLESFRPDTVRPGHFYALTLFLSSELLLLLYHYCTTLCNYVNSMCFLTTQVTLGYRFWRVVFQYTLQEQDSVLAHIIAETSFSSLRGARFLAYAWQLAPQSRKG